MPPKPPEGPEEKPDPARRDHPEASQLPPLTASPMVAAVGSPGVDPDRGGGDPRAPAAAARAGAEAAGTRPGSGALEVEARVIAAAQGRLPTSRLSLLPLPAEPDPDRDPRAGRRRGSLPGPSTATGVPNFVIRKFRVPIFLLPIYQAAGIQYGVRWEVLAAINEIETDYGRNLNVSSAGALGWMQFMPATWSAYGVDANKDGRRTRTTRSTRSSPPPATSRRPAPSRTCAGRSSPTTTPTGTSTRC